MRMQMDIQYTHNLHNEFALFSEQTLKSAIIKYDYNVPQNRGSNIKY